MKTLGKYNSNYWNLVINYCIKDTRSDASILMSVKAFIIYATISDVNI